MQRFITARYLLISLFLGVNPFILTAQETTYDNYTGTWQDAGSWQVGPPTMPYNIGGGTVTIQGNISSTTGLTFSKGTLIISDNDTLIINGDLDIGNNADLTIEDDGILIVYGNITVANKVDIAAGGFLVVTGDLTFSGSGSQGSFTSPDDPAQVYVGGTVTPPNNVDYNNFPILECGTADHTNTDCSYGDLVDVIDSGIDDLVQSGCPTEPEITSISTNSPVAVGGTIGLNPVANAGTGTWPISYYWEGPNSYSSTASNPSIASATEAMTGYYVLRVTNNEGCSIRDSSYVEVSASTCCVGSTYATRDNYTGNWEDAGSWATSFTPMPPPTEPMNTQTLCINGYITINGNLQINGGSQKICDTLVITGNLDLTSFSFSVESTGLLIVLGDFTGNSGSLTNGGNVVVVGDITNPFSSSISGGGEFYVFDDTPNIQGFTPTGDETDLATNNPGLSGFVSGLIGVTCNLSIASITATDADCFGASTGSVDLTTSGGTAPLSYLWSNSSTSEDITNLPQGSYAVTVTDDNGCTATGSATVNEPAAVSASITVTETSGTASNDGTICSGDNATLTAGGGTSYLWSTTETSTAITVSTAATYTVTVTDAGGCSNTASQIISVNVSPTPSISSSDSDNVICEGEVVTLDAGAGFSSYTWSTGGSTQTEDITNSVDLSALQTIAVTVTVSDANACSGTSSSVTVNIYPQPTIGPGHRVNTGFGN